MRKAEDIKKVIRALRKVPEKRLLIIDLTNQLTLPNGDLDVDELARRQPEVNLAIAEAKTYGNATIRAVEALNRLGSRAADAGP